MSEPKETSEKIVFSLLLDDPIEIESLVKTINNVLASDPDIIEVTKSESLAVGERNQWLMREIKYILL